MLHTKICSIFLITVFIFPNTTSPLYIQKTLQRTASQLKSTINNQQSQYTSQKRNFFGGGVGEILCGAAAWNVLKATATVGAAVLCSYIAGKNRQGPTCSNTESSPNATPSEINSKLLSESVHNPTNCSPDRSFARQLATYLPPEQFAKTMGIEISQASQNLQSNLQQEAVALASRQADAYMGTELLRKLIDNDPSLAHNEAGKKALGSLALHLSTEEWAKLFGRSEFKAYHEHQSYIKRGLHTLGQKIPISQRTLESLQEEIHSGNVQDIIYAKNELKNVYVPQEGIEYTPEQYHAHKHLGIPVTVTQASSKVQVTVQDTSHHLEQEKTITTSGASPIQVLSESTPVTPTQSQTPSFVQSMLPNIKFISNTAKESFYDAISPTSLLLSAAKIKGQGTAHTTKEFQEQLGEEIGKNITKGFVTKGMIAGTSAILLKIGIPIAIVTNPVAAGVICGASCYASHHLIDSNYDATKAYNKQHPLFKKKKPIRPSSSSPEPENNNNKDPDKNAIDTAVKASATETLRQVAEDKNKKNFRGLLHDRPASAPTGSRGANEIRVLAANRETTINGVTFSGHALDQMQGRGILSPTAVIDVIKNPAIIRPGKALGEIVYSNGSLTVVTAPSGRIKTVY